MKKNITFFGVCLLLVTLHSRLDAFFAIAIAYENRGYESQTVYKYSYGPETDILALQKAQAALQQEITEDARKNGLPWCAFVREPSKFTGDFTIAHGFFAIVIGIAMNASEPGMRVTVFGVGVSPDDPSVAVDNAKKDMIEATKNVNADVLIGIYNIKFSQVFELRYF